MKIIHIKKSQTIMILWLGSVSFELFDKQTYERPKVDNDGVYEAITGVNMSIMNQTWCNSNV